jgi:hypothetical protein
MRGDVVHRVHGLPPFIAASRRDDVARVNFTAPTQFGLDSGRPEAWHRLMAASLE